MLRKDIPELPPEMASEDNRLATQAKRRKQICDTFISILDKEK